MKFLSLYGIDAPYLTSEIVMQHVLGVEISFIVANPTYPVPISKESEFWQLLNKRAKGYPLSHIIGKREFWSNDFIVNQDVLDPRPDSETIIETVLKYYTNKKQRLKIADFGTGTGCLLTVLLKEYQYSVGIGFEKSFKACRIAYQNLKRHNLLNRARLFSSSWTKCHMQFDLIVSNPPYIKRSKLKFLQDEVQKEPNIALDGGINGLECYTSIFVMLQKCLKKNCFAILEIGEDQSGIDKLVRSYGLAFLEYVYDLSGMKRCVVIKHV
ncbi:peptide chain release factor N(5)-glutamine methyltransferase [Wolbachia pipientis]|uniref:peptide chain release factor N(5)-glutamine methyltransferase n=1 Tax=Wolbachia pipientis TaxID=955 RepID=UPI0028F6C8A2|nr:peptide chain release factor N(5)-glutamine methyltransferase [Wolbachia pipientis]